MFSIELKSDGTGRHGYNEGKRRTTRDQNTRTLRNTSRCERKEEGQQIVLSKGVRGRESVRERIGRVGWGIRKSSENIAQSVLVTSPKGLDTTEG